MRQSHEIDEFYSLAKFFDNEEFSIRWNAL